MPSFEENLLTQRHEICSQRTRNSTVVYYIQALVQTLKKIWQQKLTAKSTKQTKNSAWMTISEMTYNVSSRAGR